MVWLGSDKKKTLGEGEENHGLALNQSINQSWVKMVRLPVKNRWFRLHKKRLEMSVGFLNDIHWCNSSCGWQFGSLVRWCGKDSLFPIHMTVSWNSVLPFVKVWLDGQSSSWWSSFIVLLGNFPPFFFFKPFSRLMGRERKWPDAELEMIFYCHQIHLPLTPEASRLSHPTFILLSFSLCLSWTRWRFEFIHIPRVYGISLNFYLSWQHGSIGPHLNHPWPIEYMILFILSCHQEV